MKNKTGLVMLVVAVAGITFGALAEKQTRGKQVLFLTSGLASAELHVPEGNKVSLQSTSNTRMMSSGSSQQELWVTGGFLLKITSGTNTITIQADEVHSGP